MDLLQGVQDAAANAPEAGATPAPFEMPSVEDLLSAIENMKDLSEADRNSLKESLMSNSLPNAEHLQNVMGGGAIAAGSAGSSQFLVLFGMIGIIATILVFFGYKLYRSLTEKERRKEEKRKQKQQKKKK